ncbi:putative rhamnosyl transferase [Chryseobacterium sp. MEBOG06]|uniref:glycosyltransferase n=1 Tax=unclassified Chryseobacterium TaxID=2593645 RepID=UPI001F45E11B|nr:MULTISPECIES: glycosyltransferase [unclassified Chryseobacterium]UKB84305.1 putative rhamnosyl transferase [Chryseobacterium sp. MEBOG06]
MSQFVHVIMTRFNVPTKGWNETRSGFKPLTEEWLDDRFKLFRTYVLPSYKNQTNQNYVWLTFFDTNTSDKFRKIIKEIETEYPIFKAVFVEDFDVMKTKAVEVIPQFFTPDTKFVITSELDNDDMLHQDYIKTVQEHFKPIHDLVIDLRRGYQLTMLPGRKAVVNVYNAVVNPFVSLAESVDNFKTMLKERAHNSYRHYENFSVEDSKEMYIQIIHQYNLMNVTFKHKAVPEVDFSEYGMTEDTRFTIDRFKTLQHNIARVPFVMGLIVKKILKK